MSFDPHDLRVVRVFDDQWRWVCDADLNAQGGLHGTDPVSIEQVRHLCRAKAEYNKSLKVAGSNSMMQLFTNEELLAMQESGAQTPPRPTGPPAVQVIQTPLDGAAEKRKRASARKAAAMIFPGSILVRVLSTTRQVSGVAGQLFDALNLRGAHSARTRQAKIIEALIEALKDSGWLVMIDEAHRLADDALELVRDLHDECGVPVVLAGTIRLNEKCSDADQFFGQFTSRIALRYDVTESVRVGHDHPDPLHTVEEIRKLYDSDKVRLTDDGANLLTDLSNVLGLGGLRLCTMIVMVASQVAAADGLEVIDARLIRRVIRRLHGGEHSAQTIERALDRSRVKVRVA